MIAANDVRVGNWVDMFDCFNGDYSFMQIHPAHIKYISNGECRCNPIPLTPEILEKAGFVNGGYDGLFWTNKQTGQEVEFSGIESETGFAAFGVCYNSQVDVHLEYVHELQNLFYALTRQELQINI